MIAWAATSAFAFVPAASRSSGWTKISENATDYSLQNTVRHALFLPTSRGQVQGASRRSTPSSCAPATCFRRSWSSSACSGWRSRCADSRWSMSCSSACGWCSPAGSLARIDKLDGSETRLDTRRDASLDTDLSSRWPRSASPRLRMLDAQEPATRAETLQRQREEKAKTPRATGAQSPRARADGPRERAPLRTSAESRRRAVPEDGERHERQRILARPGLPARRHVRRARGLQHVCRGIAEEVLDDRRAAADAATGEQPGRSRSPRADATTFPKEGFFGLGPDSLRENEVIYGLANTVFGATGTYRPTPWLNIGGGVEHFSPTIRAETGARRDPQHLRPV